jgi:hypothetical protein
MPTLVAVLDPKHVVPSPKDSHPAPSSMCYCGTFDAKAPGNIGRVANPGLHIPDLRVSEVHAVVQFENGQFVLQDRGSTNGTEVLLHGALWRLVFDPKNPAMNDRHALADHEQFFVGGVPVFFFLENMSFDQACAAAEERRALGIRRAETYPRMERKHRGETL